MLTSIAADSISCAGRILQSVEIGDDELKLGETAHLHLVLVAVADLKPLHKYKFGISATVLTRESVVNDHPIAYLSCTIREL
ncbi:unnamed protein product [Phytophthora lilii]|uniref:Unnamed protein product n=1 Tax=Phytophthora lilii TaxID=2077276 RepID=A0A9W6TF66_9STRA|nr:unnamed protein product [Phytophthora lilii]